MIAYRCPSKRAALILGEAPVGVVPSWEWLAPGTTCSADRLLRLSGLEAEQFLRLFDRTNLMCEPRAFDEATLAAAGLALLEHLQLERKRWVEVLCLGWRVADALPWTEDYRPESYFEPGTLHLPGHVPGPSACVVPHPSGINRWWNDKLNHVQARTFFARIVHEITYGAEVPKWVLDSRSR